jgi:hypothetical protein
VNKDFFIVDDFLGSSYSEGIKDNSMFVNWQYNDRTYTNELSQAVFIDDKTVDCPQMISQIYPPVNKNDSEFLYLKSVIHSVEDLLQTKIKGIVRMKYNLLLPNPKFGSNNYNVPHLDMGEDDFVTALYYVSDSTGDTVLFNEQYNGSKPDSLTIRERVSPKQNRLLIFKSNIWHASSNPVDGDRRVINMILKI